MTTTELISLWHRTGREVEAELKSIGAWLAGHFVFASGLHGTEYVDNKPLFEPENKATLERLARALAGRILEIGIDFDAITGPAKGGLALATCVAPYLTQVFRKKIWVVSNEKDGEEFKIMTAGDLRGTRVVFVEDTVTSGGSLKRLRRSMDLVGIDVVACVSILNRNGQTADSLGFRRFETLLDKKMEALTRDDCRRFGACRNGPQINTEVGRGSRFVQEHGQFPLGAPLGTGP